MSRPWTLAAFVSASVVLPALAYAQATLVEAARRQGADVTSMVHVDGPEADLRMLLGDRAIVARGHFVGAVSRLTQDQRNVETEYRFQLTECLKCGAETPDPIVSVVRLGGSIQLEDGHRVSTQVEGFPDFDDGDDYILFLSRTNGPYAVRFGPQGTFRVRGQRAEHVANADWAARLDVADLARLVAAAP